MKSEGVIYCVTRHSKPYLGNHAVMISRTGMPSTIEMLAHSLVVCFISSCNDKLWGVLNMGEPDLRRDSAPLVKMLYPPNSESPIASYVIDVHELT
jgi:hypothetical protein